MVPASTLQWCTLAALAFWSCLPRIAFPFCTARFYCNAVLCCTNCTASYIAGGGLDRHQAVPPPLAVLRRLRLCRPTAPPAAAPGAALAGGLAPCPGQGCGRHTHPAAGHRAAARRGGGGAPAGGTVVGCTVSQAAACLQGRRCPVRQEGVASNVLLANERRPLPYTFEGIGTNQSPPSLTYVQAEFGSRLGKLGRRGELGELVAALGALVPVPPASPLLTAPMAAHLLIVAAKVR